MSRSVWLWKYKTRDSPDEFMLCAWRPRDTSEPDQDILDEMRRYPEIELRATEYAPVRAKGK